jgi:hypothetical protein
MQIRQQRRRRLWSDDTSAAAGDAPARSPSTSSKRSTGPAETYTSQARRDEQPRLTDLIPTRYRTLLLIFVAGLLILAGLELLYFRIDALAVHVVREALGVFDLASRGSFAAWYSSLLLSVTAIVAALIFTLRRHRIDDYRGRYRIWIWGTLGYLALAVNQTADLDDLLREVVDQVATRAGASQPWIWTALCVSVWSVCVVRLSFELRPSRGALLLGWLGAVAWLFSSTGADLLKLETPAALVMATVGLKLLGQLTILAAHVAYARYVLLDAHGLLPARAAEDANQPRRRRKRAEKIDGDTAAKPASAGRSDLDPPLILGQKPTAQPSAAKTEPVVEKKPLFSKPATAAADESDDDEDEDSPANEGLTRAERKRLRRERKLDRRNAA